METRINGIYLVYWYDGRCFDTLEDAQFALMEDHPEFLDDDLPGAFVTLISEDTVE